MRLRTVLRIARWEVLRGTDALDRRTAIIAAVGVVTVVLLGGAVATTGIAHDRGIYRVGVDEASPYYAAVDADPTFVVRDASPAALRAGDIDVLIDGTRVVGADSPKGHAARAELRSTVASYNDEQLRAEVDQAAAFPVSVDLRYAVQGDGQVPSSGDASADGRNGSVDDGGTDDSGTDDTGDAGDGTTDTPATPGGSDGGLFGFLDSSDDGGLPAVAGEGLFTEAQAGTPSDLQPPFPMASLVLAFLFIIPMNVAIQIYGSSVLKERINRRGELLLVSPVTRGEIIAGKTLPYFLGLLVVAAVIATAIGGSWLSVLAVAPIAVLFLAAVFVAAMFARSFKELTFVTVTITVSLTAYAFIPAIFTNITPIALISPLTVVVMDLQGDPVTVGQFLFSVLPIATTGAVLFVLGAGVYREEDMFTQRPVPQKALDAIAARIRGPGSAVWLSILTIPFVFAAELLVVAALFALPTSVSLGLLFLGIATIEELAKSVHVYAGFSHGRYDRSFLVAGLVGALSGLGFFLGEKLTVVVQLVGLPELDIGRAAFAPAIPIEGLPILALLLAPLALHVLTAMTTAFGAARDRGTYASTLVLAIVLHTLYNLVVVSYVA